MHLKTKIFPVLFLLLGLIYFSFLFSSCKKNTNILLKEGMVINQSVTVLNDTFRIDSDIYLKNSAILIEGENIVVDFQGAVLQGSNDKDVPNEFYGLGISVKGENIEIKNLKIHGYKVGLKAIDVNTLKITNCDFSHNFRHKVSAKPFDWVSDGMFNVNVAGIDLHRCKDIEIKNNKICQGQNGIVLSFCQKGNIYNNTITHNSNFAITLLSSSYITIMHNYLDWNIRDFKDGIGNGGGINSSLKSKKNTVAFNSMTHNGRNTFGGTVNIRNDFFPFQNPTPPEDIIVIPFSDGQKIDSAKYKYRGEKYILIDEWGPYNFEYPAIWLREINGDKYTFGIFGPEGNWKIVDGSGFVQTSRQSGAVPATVVATKASDAEEDLRLNLEFIGVDFTDQLGKKNKRGKTFKFGFQKQNED